MKIIKADHTRRIDIPGVPNPVRRPVDIDQSITGFVNLRTLRIYGFDQGVTIDGHAEEDEVFVIVLAGSIEFTISGDNSGHESRFFRLSAPGDSHSNPCVAYLPPHSAYKLLANTDAEVTYARATPASGDPAQVFAPQAGTDAAGVTVLLQEDRYAKRLRVRLTYINAQQAGVDVTPIPEAETVLEAFIHVRTDAMLDGGIQLDSWDTVAASPGDRLTLHIPALSSGLILVVQASA